MAYMYGVLMPLSFVFILESVTAEGTLILFFRFVRPMLSVSTGGVQRRQLPYVKSSIVVNLFGFLGQLSHRKNASSFVSGHTSGPLWSTCGIGLVVLGYST